MFKIELIQIVWNFVKKKKRTDVKLTSILLHAKYNKTISLSPDCTAIWNADLLNKPLKILF